MHAYYIVYNICCIILYVSARAWGVRVYPHTCTRLCAHAQTETRAYLVTHNKTHTHTHRTTDRTDQTGTRTRTKLALARARPHVPYPLPAD